MKRLQMITIIVLGALLIALIAGCKTVDTNNADVTDETFLTPPEQEGEIIGTWNAQADELTIDRYFYGDGKLVTIIMDTEEESTCVLSTWSEEGDKVTIDNLETYRYNDSDGVWNKEDTSTPKESMTKSGDTLSSQMTLPDGVNQNFEFKRGLAEISVPASTDLTGYINAFLEH